jgi:hypothetical protein
MKWLARLCVVAATLLTTTFAPAVPVDAAVVAAFGAGFAGEGTFSPGIPSSSLPVDLLLQSPQTIHFSSLAGVGGGAAVLATSVPGAVVGATGPLVGCWFDGQGSESVLIGVGQLAVGCLADPVYGGVNCTVNYVRVGVVVVVLGVNTCAATFTAALGGLLFSSPPTTADVGVLLLVPKNFDPITEFVLVGVDAFAGAKF